MSCPCKIPLFGVVRSDFTSSPAPYHAKILHHSRKSENTLLVFNDMSWWDVGDLKSINGIRQYLPYKSKSFLLQIQLTLFAAYIIYIHTVYLYYPFLPLVISHWCKWEIYTKKSGLYHIHISPKASSLQEWVGAPVSFFKCALSQGCVPEDATGAARLEVQPWWGVNQTSNRRKTDHALLKAQESSPSHQTFSCLQ